jgi:hypothetical protein
MAISQIKTSKKPITGAQVFSPFDTITILIVPMVTSTMRERKIRNGSKK